MNLRRIWITTCDRWLAIRLSFPLTYDSARIDGRKRLIMQSMKKSGIRMKLNDRPSPPQAAESAECILVLQGGGALGAYVHAMYLNDEAPIAGGRELWGFPKK